MSKLSKQTRFEREADGSARIRIRWNPFQVAVIELANDGPDLTGFIRDQVEDAAIRICRERGIEIPDPEGLQP